MSVDILVGLQWGDEGKGKIIDLLSPKYNIVARFQGGPNAGHTLLINNKKFVFHTLPSGVIHPHAINILGSGMVIDPVVFKKEAEIVIAEGLNPFDNVVISRNAHLILPSHKYLDSFFEEKKGTSKIGSTLKGIGPTYQDKIGRVGLRIGTITDKDFKQKFNVLKDKHFTILDESRIALSENEEEMWFEAIEFISKFKISDTELFLNHQIDNKANVLIEGAQGTLLDINFGTYPYVTSSSTIAAGACTGLGLSPKKIDNIYGVFKAYTTRVGEGPFLTEQKNEIGKYLTEKGFEYGSTTGRQRRCGWLDMVALKYSCMLNGVNKLVITKPDVLSGLKEINICTKYSNGFNDNLTYSDIYYNVNCSPVFRRFEGWSDDISDIKNYNLLPDNFKQYLRFIEHEIKCNVNIISVGPERNQTIYK